ncbi:hypothetical protein EV401DRAFT_2047376 [Pisolithus croceorrhizus]|nr:hypothetical protein EV401DRAFT_2047376 [Pisolithus croceorrhizus]
MAIHYGPSVVNMGHPFCAENLTVRRMLLEVFVHAVDGRPVEIHDLLLTHTWSGILTFLGSMEESPVVEIDVFHWWSD